MDNEGGGLKAGGGGGLKAGGGGGASRLAVAAALSRTRRRPTLRSFSRRADLQKIAKQCSRVRRWVSAHRGKREERPLTWLAPNFLQIR